jgi:hypothetical protein
MVKSKISKDPSISSLAERPEMTNPKRYCPPQVIIAGLENAAEELRLLAMDQSPSLKVRTHTYKES